MTLALFRFGPVVLLAAVGLAACATPPAPKPAASPPPTPTSDTHVEMAPIPNPTPREEPRRVRPAPAELPAQKPAETPPPPPIHPPGPSNPLRAAQLRGAGLEQLNRGAINKAIALLKEANELDPGNALIKHDLDRALRVDKALHEKH